LQIKTKIVSCHTADAKPVKQEVNGTIILPPLVFPGLSLTRFLKRVYCNEEGQSNEESQSLLEWR